MYVHFLQNIKYYDDLFQGFHFHLELKDIFVKTAHNSRRKAVRKVTAYSVNKRLTFKIFFLFLYLNNENIFFE